MHRGSMTGCSGWGQRSLIGAVTQCPVPCRLTSLEQLVLQRCSLYAERMWFLEALSRFTYLEAVECYTPLVQVCPALPCPALPCPTQPRPAQPPPAPQPGTFLRAMCMPVAHCVAECPRSSVTWTAGILSHSPLGRCTSCSCCTNCSKRGTSQIAPRVLARC